MNEDAKWKTVKEVAFAKPTDKIQKSVTSSKGKAVHKTGNLLGY